MKEDIPKDIWTILGDATQLHQVLMNLCVNARDAMHGGGTLTLSAENKFIDEHYTHMQMDAKPGKYLILVVQDTGTGMPPKIRDSIFEPFFTTKEQGKGTAFRVYLPASESAQELTAATEQESYPTGNGELILVVDDEESILQITKQTLDAFGYQAITASDGTEAVTLYASKGRDIALVLTDMMMPFMDGSRTIRALRKMNPSVKIIASSGLATNGSNTTSDDSSADAFVVKPYTADKLLKAIHSVLHGQTQ